ncbi:PEPxxWA-CTERM sorting domain-containing protein [Sphingomonas sp. MMS24-JH45]
MLLATGVCVGTLTLLPGVGTKGVIAAAAEALADPSKLFAARSPGAREAGALYDTKPARERFAGVPRSPAAAGLPPTERVLTTVRDRPTPYVDLPRGLAPFVDVPGAAPPVLPGALPPTLPGGGFPGGGGLLPGGGTGGGGGGGGGDIPGVPGIPEPTTWAMMILGFFGIAATMRHRQRRGRRTHALAVDG